MRRRALAAAAAAAGAAGGGAAAGGGLRGGAGGAPLQRRLGALAAQPLPAGRTGAVGGSGAPGTQRARALPPSISEAVGLAPGEGTGLSERRRRRTQPPPLQPRRQQREGAADPLGQAAGRDAADGSLGLGVFQEGAPVRFEARVASTIFSGDGFRVLSVELTRAEDAAAARAAGVLSAPRAPGGGGGGGGGPRGRGGGARLVAAGVVPDVFEGSTYVFSGRWAVHNRFGRQVALESARFVQPTGVAEIEAYLVSSVKHVGKVTAKRLTDAFGMDVLRVLDMPNSEAMLVSVPGIGASTAAKIASSWGSSRDLREALDFLTDHGVSSTMAYRIANTYGEDTQRVVKERPFGATSGVRGMRWDDQVKLANALRMPPHCTDRYGTALRKVLGAGMGYGHTCLPQSRLMAKAGELLEQHLPPEEVHKPELLVEALAERAARTSDARTQRVASKGRDTGAGSGVEVVSFDAGEPMCYLPHVWEAEGGLARSFVQRMTRQASPRTRAARQVHANEATAWLKENFTTLSDQQRGVVVEAARSDMLVINGGPGSGKTYLLAAMSKFFRSVGKDVALCAPTGRAARRMAESAKHPASTIHRLLGFKPAPDIDGDDDLQGAFEHNAENPLECDVLIVDEGSMLDASLAHALMSALPESATLIMLGDVDQLPPVGAGQPFADLVALSRARTDLECPVASLAENFRQAAGSTIPEVAARVNTGDFELLRDSMHVADSPEQLRAYAGADHPDVLWVRAQDGASAAQATQEVVRSHLMGELGFSPRDIMVLSPMKIRASGTVALNGVLRPVLNSSAAAGGAAHSYTRLEHTYCVGDRVMQIKNNADQDVYNGDLGYVTHVDPMAKRVEVRFEDDGTYGAAERRLSYVDGGQKPGGDKDSEALPHLGELQPAWAMTIHKSQGSEFPCVVLVLLGDHRRMHERRLLYTAMTRAREKLVVVYDDDSTVVNAIRPARSEARISMLGELVQGALSDSRRAD